MRIHKAVVPAAGLGTRFLPATKAQPKEMLPIVDKPTIQYVIEEAVASGIEDILIVTGKDKRAIEDHFDRAVELESLLARRKRLDLLRQVRRLSEMADIHYVRQKEPLGLGHAVWCARRHVGDEPFAVLLGDDVVASEVPCLAQLIREYERHGCPVLGVQRVPPEEVSRYGVVEARPAGERLWEVRSLVEKPSPGEAPSNLAIIGRYVLVPEVFAILERQAPGAGGEIQLTDALKSLNATRPLLAYEFEGTRYDVGDRMGYLRATVELALAREDIGEPFRAYLRGLLAGGAGHRPPRGGGEGQAPAGISGSPD